ncbi:aminopeptidase P family protein [Acidipila sp. EB88]|nr:aminopeptidase P family protein [Acidipila sp. EB88]
MNHKARLQALRSKLALSSTRALLLTHGPDVRYLSGFTGSNAVLLVFARSTVLLTDGRYTTQARQETAGSGARVVIGKRLASEACVLLLRAGVTSVAYDSNHTTVAALSRFEAALPESHGKVARRRFFSPMADSPVASLRQVKDSEELQGMAEAAAVGCQIFEDVLHHLAAGVAEREIAAELEYAARRRGAEGMSFDTIVASGRRSALPHGHASAQPLPRRGFVTMDFGVILGGYCSDMTRTVYMGKPTREEKSAYQAVLEAEQAGIEAVRAGVTGASVDAASRAVLRRAGLANYFSHSTGHGVGLEIHEGPRLAAKSEDVLAEGMVVTVEPGVYLPERFGIRIEDMVVVEATGARVLTFSPKELLML